MEKRFAYLIELFQAIKGKGYMDRIYDSIESSVGLSQASTDLLDAYSSTNTNGAFPRRVTNTSSYNGWSVYDCLASIRKHQDLQPEELEIIIVDNNSRDTDGIAARRAFPTPPPVFRQ